ncbi:MAG: DNA repair protein RecO [Mangrovicoccus sp.]
MEWREEGLVLAVRRHGENAAIVEALTPSHGRHAGVVRGGAGRRLSPLLQPGNLLDLSWRARLSDHLGSYSVDLHQAQAAAFLADRLALAGLGAVTGLLCYALPERQPMAELYRQTRLLLALMLQTSAWPLAYLQWEEQLLAEMGFALDLSRCAATGGTEDLIYVSPKSGRAVSRHGAGDWADKLLPLPPCLRGEGEAPNREIALALSTTGYFLERHLTPQWTGQPFPAARARLVSLLTRPE